MPSWPELHNRHRGEVGLVLGNGKSLRDVPREVLEYYPSLGSNRIYLLDGFAPNYYAVVNPLVLEQYLSEIRLLESVKFVRGEYADKVPGSLALYSKSVPSFSHRPDQWIYEGHTVTYVLLQLAYYLGFATVYLLGVDHHYICDGKPNQKLYMDTPDPNHFDSNYFRGAYWHAPDLARAEQAYRMARQVYEQDGRRIINCTPGSHLDVFERGEVVL